MMHSCLVLILYWIWNTLDIPTNLFLVMGYALLRLMSSMYRVSVSGLDKVNSLIVPNIYSQPWNEINLSWVWLLSALVQLKCNFINFRTSCSKPDWASHRFERSFLIVIQIERRLYYCCLHCRIFWQIQLQRMMWLVNLLLLSSLGSSPRHQNHLWHLRLLALGSLWNR